MEREEKFEHYWEMCVGSCHAYTALRADYRKQLKRVHDELGFSYVRFHGLFNDDMSVCIQAQSLGEEKAPIYNFCNIDNIIDYLLEIGMRPFFELGDMPSCIAADKIQYFNYHMHVSPPKDIRLWNELIERFIKHLLERYGKDEVEKWYFEVWNEPNNAMFWSGTKEQYFELYENTVKVLKYYDSNIRVGGPATSCNMWIKEFIEYCEKNDISIDFISTHHYPADELLWKKGDFAFEDVINIIMSGQKRTFHKDIMYQMAKRAASDAGKYPVIYTEWNTSAQPNDYLHDECYASAMVTKILIENKGLVKGYSFWTFTDIFEECAQYPGPYHGGFGLLNYYGVPKPVYRSMQLLADTGDVSFPIIADDLGNVGAIAVKRGNGIRLIIYNYNVPDSEVRSEKICVLLPEEYENRMTFVTKIDEEHSNPKALWERMGKPEYLNKNQIVNLEQESELKPERVLVTNKELMLEVPAYGVVAIDFNLE